MDLIFIIATCVHDTMLAQRLHKLLLAIYTNKLLATLYKSYDWPKLHMDDQFLFRFGISISFTSKMIITEGQPIKNIEEKIN